MDDARNDEFPDGFPAPAPPAARAPKSLVLTRDAITLLAAAQAEREALYGRVAQLEAALAPFAEFAAAMDQSAHSPHLDDDAPVTRFLLRPTMGEARDARDALACAIPLPEAA